MHSYKNLYEFYLSAENIEKSIWRSNRNKDLWEKYYSKAIGEKVILFVLKVQSQKYVDAFREYAKNFKNEKHSPKIIYDGISRKQRTIIIPTLDEQVVHHMIINTLQPIFKKSFYYHSYASIPGKGGTKGIKAMKKWIQNDYEGVKYCAKADIHHYFESIDHNYIKGRFKKIIKDKKFLNIIYQVIGVIDKGIPIGFYTSQWFANWILTPLDHYIKEVLGVKYYIRYMDDIVLLGDNKEYLHQCLKKINQFIAQMGLKLKDNWQIFRFSDIDENDEDTYRFIDFMGFRFYKNRVIIRNKIMKKCTRKCKRVSKKEKPTVYQSRQVTSYFSWLNHTDSYNVYLDYVKPYIDYQKLRKRISKYDRRRNEHFLQEIIVHGQTLGIRSLVIRVYHLSQKKYNTVLEKMRQHEFRTGHDNNV